MIGMQYKIHFPRDYDMNIIRKRVADNGQKTDGFYGLFFKAYLIQEIGQDTSENIYAPLYIWTDSKGMNEFVFGGFYDNIIKSFGWLGIKIGVPYGMDLKDEFNQSKYVIEVSGELKPSESIASSSNENFQPNSKYIDIEGYTGYVCIYQPDQWKYSFYYFYKNRPEHIHKNSIYEILHISRGVDKNNTILKIHYNK